MSDGGKIVLKGRLECLAPLHIGSGNDDNSDLDILRDAQGLPYIPATSLVGVLRHTTERYLSEDLRKFWGYTEKKDGQQSALCCSDLICVDAKADSVIRDGIKIDNRSGIVEDTGKYDYEAVERGAKFDFSMEFSYRETTEDLVKRMAATIYELLAGKKVRLGAKSNSGLGEVQLCEKKSSMYEFNFSNKRHVFRWLSQQYDNETRIPNESIRKTLGEAFDIAVESFSIDAAFLLKNSMIVRSYSSDPSMPDATHITSGKDWVLPGTSLKGAIRARAERIVNTLGKPPEIIDGLFGYVKEGKNPEEQKVKKGRICVHETLLPKFTAEQQTRIKIDRFSGGTIESALFDTMPLFGNDTPIESVRIDIEECKDHEAGLLLLVLKDLWTGDLAVGGEKNVGRGVLQGIIAEITCPNGEKHTLQQNSGTLPETDHLRKTLQTYVRALNEYTQEKEASS